MTPADHDAERLDLLHQMGAITRMRRGRVNEQSFIQRRRDGSVVTQGPYYLYSRTEQRRVKQPAHSRGGGGAVPDRDGELPPVQGRSGAAVHPRLRAPDSAGRRGEKKLQAAFAAEIGAEVEALVGEEAAETLDFEAVETAARRGALAVAARAVARRLNADDTDHAGPRVACRCGQPAHYAGRKVKTILTALGAMPLERAYYHCATCRRGFCPRDRVLGVEGTSLSPAVTRMVGTAAELARFTGSTNSSPR